MNTARRHEKRIGSAKSISIGALVIAAGAVDASTTINIPGAGLDAVVCVTVQTPTAGVVWDACVTSPSTITIRASNVTGSSKTTTATIGQVQTLLL